MAVWPSRSQRLSSALGSSQSGMARVLHARGSPPGSPSERRRVRFDPSTCMAVALMVILLRTSAQAVERVAAGDAARQARARALRSPASGAIEAERARLAGAVGNAAWGGATPGSDDPASASTGVDARHPNPLPALLSNASSLVANPTPSNDDGTRKFPSDVSGTFKGAWRLVPALGSDGEPNGTVAGALPGMSRFDTKEEGGAGVVILQLTSAWDPATNVQWVRAEMAVRDGTYVTSQDVHLRMRGVYVEPTGFVHLVSESTLDHAFRGADEGGDERGDERGGLGASYREALRIASRDVVGTPFTSTLTEDTSRPENVPGSAGLSALQRGERLRRIDGSDAGEYPAHCKFSLKARVTPGSFKPIDRGEPGVETRGSDGEEEGDWDAFGELARGEGGARHRKLGAGSGWRRERSGSSRRSGEGFSAPGEGGKGEPSMVGTLRSEDCGYELQVRASWFRLEDYYRKAMNYSLMIIFTVPAQIYLLVKQTEYSGTQAGMAKISLACVGWQAVLDSYQCLMHLTAGIIVETLFHSFSTAAFFQFTLFSVFEMRVLLQIWKSRRPNSEQNWLEIRRDLSALYSRFYGGFLLGFVIMYWCADSPWFIALLCNSYWLPQIAWSAWHNAKKPLMPAYVLGTSAIRLLVPLYVFGCPENFVRVKPQFWVCWLLVVWVAAQVTALAAQHVFGPRCFIPDKYLPEVYDYHRRVEPEVLASAGAGDEECGEAGGVDCVICMNAVDATAPRERMVTPCNHFFHRECLERWMEVKMECPTCRGALPPL